MNAEHEKQLTEDLQAVGAKLRFRKSGRVHTVDLSRCQGGDDMLLQRLVALERLAVLNLAHTQVTDKALDTVSQLPRLETLDLQGTEISDAALPVLEGLSQLKILVLTDSRISQAAVRQLRRVMLNTRIVHLS